MTLNFCSRHFFFEIIFQIKVCISHSYVRVMKKLLIISSGTDLALSADLLLVKIWLSVHLTNVVREFI